MILDLELGIKFTLLTGLKLSQKQLALGMSTRNKQLHVIFGRTNQYSIGKAIKGIFSQTDSTH